MRSPVTNRFFLLRRRLITVLVSLAIGACSPVGYYAQSISGHTQILAKREKITDLLRDETLDEGLRDRLLTVTQIVDFANRDLNLPDNGSYRHYTDTGRDYVVWNVFAAPELGLETREWCYLFLGCMNYRGYFNRERAIRYAGKLEGQGLDVYVGGVSAYSTLGWFRDPVLNTMINRDSWALARLIFHEMAHQKLFIAGDTAFNEAFADTVAIIGVTRWLATKPAMDRERVIAMLAHENDFAALALETRQKLVKLYATNREESYQQHNKTIIINNFRESLSNLSVQWQDKRFQSWIEGDVNNARLAAVSTYRELVPGFMRIFEDTGNDLPVFYKRIAAFAHCPASTRHEILQAGTSPQSCTD